MSDCFHPMCCYVVPGRQQSSWWFPSKTKYWIARPASLGTCHSFSWPLLFRQAFQECHNLCSYFKLYRPLSNTQLDPLEQKGRCQLLWRGYSHCTLRIGNLAGKWFSCQFARCESVPQCWWTLDELLRSSFWICTNEDQTLELWWLKINHELER